MDLLPRHPLQDYGILRLVDEATQATAMGLDPAILRYLPPTLPHFQNLAETA